MPDFQTESIIKTLQNYELRLVDRRLALLEDTFQYYSAAPYGRRAVGRSDRTTETRFLNK
ncbi:hypothetical protein [Myxosarcina sp. GI1]|uniref:hypothetical protein n=1 Tax=Myxosarcina sp. GI1 TaxID=1541065 RepID=UPI000561C8F8|nr:hypothetical protein [Myxosarcina sp. GI1]